MEAAYPGQLATQANKQAASDGPVSLVPTLDGLLGLVVASMELRVILRKQLRLVYCV